MQTKLCLNRKSGLSRNLRIGVLCGGSSSERKISLRSGRAVRAALKRLGFTVVSLDPARPNLLQKLSKIDLAFIALHGHGGEDGTIQKILERRNLPYVGADARASLRAFDKEMTKQCCLQHRVPTASFAVIKQSRDILKLSEFTRPFVVKPVRNGSSVGVFFVDDFEKSLERIKSDFKKYGPLLIEEQIRGREFTVGILNERPLPVIELVPKRAFYDYKAKYTKGMTNYLVPAPITKMLTARLQKIALRVHRELGLRDFSRIDIMVDGHGCPYVLEANSIPGLTELSLLPKAAGAVGISFESMCELLLSQAYRRHVLKEGKKNMRHSNG